MKYYFAPLEGITGYTYRNVHHALFGGPDAYYAPFIQPKQTHELETREKKDIDPQNNQGISLIPQIMANKVDLFLWACEELRQRNYSVVNLNLGCPRQTIVSRHKGSGMLDNLENLKVFLDGIFEGSAKTGMRISIKTRLGTDNFDDALRMIEIFNQYPLDELIIHPRTRRDMYQGRPNHDVFQACAENTRHRICYNGNLFSKADYESWKERFARYPQIHAVMPARGLIANPALIREMKGGKAITKQELRLYHDELYRAYDALQYGTSTLLHRMNELWFYLGCNFAGAEKLVHKIRKARNCGDYLAAVDRIFDTCDIGGHFEGR